mgnify:CR=1 FL=1
MLTLLHIFPAAGLAPGPSPRGGLADGSLGSRPRGLDALSHLALDAVREAGEEEAFIIGGAQIYRLALEMGVVDTMYLTHVEREYEGDTWFPDFALSNWKAQPLFRHVQDDRNEAPFTIQRYDRLPVVEGA